MGKFIDNIKKGVDKVKDAVNKTVDIVKDSGGKIAATAALAPLLPFKGVISDALSKKGISPSSDFLTLIKQFYQNIIPSNFDGRVTKYHADAQGVDWENAISIATKVVPLITAFINNLKKKKEEGQPLTPEETALINKTAEIGGGSATGADSDEEGFKIFGFNGWLVLGGISLVGLGFWYYMKKRKKK